MNRALQGSVISERQIRLVTLAAEVETTGEPPGGHYASRIMAQLSLPYRDPGDVPAWSRRNNAITLTISPGLVPAQDGSRVRGYPYGVIPRYLLTWMTTEAVRTRNRQLCMGDSLGRFLNTLGMNSSGASGRRVLDQLHRLAVASLNVEDARRGEGRWDVAGANFPIASRYDLWFRTGQTPAPDRILGSTLILSEEFYADAVASPVRLRPDVLRALSGSPMRLDMYTWLVYRLRSLGRPSTVSWTQLAEQFGAEYALRRQFKAAFLRNLNEVRLFLPANSFTVLEAGIRLNRTRRNDPTG